MEMRLFKIKIISNTVSGTSSTALLQFFVIARGTGCASSQIAKAKSLVLPRPNKGRLKEKKTKVVPTKKSLLRSPFFRQDCWTQADPGAMRDLDAWDRSPCATSASPASWVPSLGSLGHWEIPRGKTEFCFPFLLDPKCVWLSWVTHQELETDKWLPCVLGVLIQLLWQVEPKPLHLKFISIFGNLNPPLIVG